MLDGSTEHEISSGAPVTVDTEADVLPGTEGCEEDLVGNGKTEPVRRHLSGVSPHSRPFAVEVVKSRRLWTHWPATWPLSKWSR